MSRFTTILSVIFIFVFGDTCLGQVPIYDMKRMQDVKDAYQHNVRKVVRIVNALEEQADAYLEMPCPHVTDKDILPPSKDPRDFISLSKYWWPDPEKADGLPYIRHDGVVNPEVDKYPDVTNAMLVGKSTQILGALYYITGKKEYASKCAEIIRSWFLDPEKGINPNMTYGQFVPGMKQLRGNGVLDSHYSYLRAIGGLYFIRGTEYWTREDDKAFNEWARAYCYWVEHSTNGQVEQRAANNHGLWYEFTRLMLKSLYCSPDELRAVIKDAVLPRMASQIAEDGTLPKELARTLSLSYSCYATEALISINKVASNIGMDLWGLTTDNGRSMEMIVKYLVPYFKDPSSWPHEQISPFETQRRGPILYEAGTALGRKDWVRLSRKMGYKQGNDIDALIYYML